MSFETTTAWIHHDADSIPLTVEIAQTERQQVRGLSRRAELAPDAGMLFVFDEMRPASAGFWMWQTRFPLDAAFLDEDGVIFEILAMEPCESPEPEGCPAYTPGAPYWFALEVNRSWFSRNGVQVGARVTLSEEEP